ncbi:hypothetical protein ES708_31500 [subsurface metagenome]
MLENPADRVQTGIGETGISLAGKGVGVPLPQRNVDVHAAAVVVENRFGHESNRLVVPASGVLDHVLVLKQLVRHGHQARKAHVDLSLTSRGCLMVLRLDFDSDTFENQHHLGAQILLAVRRRNRKVPFFVPGLVAQVRRLNPSGIPAPFYRIDMVVALMLVLIETDVVEDEKLRLRSEIGGVGQLGLFEVILRFYGDMPGIPGVILACNRIADVADQYECFFGQKGIDEGRFGDGLDQHIRFVDALPAPDARSVETETILK